MLLAKLGHHNRLQQKIQEMLKHNLRIIDSRVQSAEPAHKTNLLWKPYITTFTGEEDLGAQSLIYSVLVCHTETHPRKRMGCSTI
jgi:hypothetical protein